jgi:rhodanese-related sulfurtransferase
MTIPEITPAEAKKLLDENNGYVYLDVRSVAEFLAGHAPGAMNIPIAEPNPATGQMEPNPDFLSVVEATIPRDAKLIVGCKSGGRSARACGILDRAGYTNPHNLVGGFGGAVDPAGEIVAKGWSMLGYPVERGEGGERGYKSLAAKTKSDAR